MSLKVEIFLLAVAVVACTAQTEVLLYSNDGNCDVLARAPYTDLTAIVTNADYDDSFGTILYNHGWSEGPDISTGATMRDALCTLKNKNLLYLNYTQVASQGYIDTLFQAMPIAKMLGSAIAQVVPRELLPNWHLIGHSLGGQMAGQEARSIFTATGVKVGRISALDPANPGFKFVVGVVALYQALSATDATFVDCIHTDAGCYGFLTPVGHADFWVNRNGKALQPGCPTPTSTNGQDTCSHKRSAIFYAESIVSSDPNTFVSAPAVNSVAFRYGIGTTRRPAVQMGYHCPTTAIGNYYLQTGGASPYSLGQAGRTYNNNIRYATTKCDFLSQAISG